MDPPIDNVDPKTQADECVKIALDAMASASAGHPPTLPHIRNVAGHALERLKELELLVDRLAKIMRHVASNTRDSWARDYICQRLNDHGFPASLNDPVRTDDDDGERCYWCGKAGGTNIDGTFICTNPECDH